MKNIFIFIALFPLWSSAQDQKITGGCAYGGSIDEITPGLISDTYLLNGTAYSVKVNLMDFFQVCTGDIKLKLDDIVIGQQSNCTTGEYTIPTVLINFPPAEYTLKYYFYGGYSSAPDWSLMASKKVAVLNHLHVKQASAEPRLVVYPNPAIERVTMSIDHDVFTDISVMSVTGQLMQTLKCSTSKVTLQINELPAGLYLVQVQTEKNAYVQKLEVLK